MTQSVTANDINQPTNNQSIDEAIKTDISKTNVSNTKVSTTNVSTTKVCSQIDPSVFGRVAVIYGGYSNERTVSLNSGLAVLQALLDYGIDAHKFDPKEHNIVELGKYDRVFNVLHGRGGEDGQLQGLLQWLDIPQTGSGVLASALGMDKVRTKQLWQGCGLPTASFAVLDVDTDWQQVVDRLGLPIMVKPVHEGSSIGMSKVTKVDELSLAFDTAAACSDIVMAEQWISGSEYTIVIIDDEAYPVIRLEPAAVAQFYDFEAKYESNDTGYHIPCGLSSEDEIYLQNISLQAFRALEGTGWGRVDAMRDDEGKFWLLEVNTVPGMTEHSLVPMAAAARGMDFKALCVKILSQTLS